MTEDHDTINRAEGKVLTADQINEIQPQLIGWIRRNGALDPENIAGNVNLVLVQKYVGKPLTNDTLLPLAIKIAGNELSDERREGADKIRRDRRVTVDEKALAAAANTSAAENDAADQVIENKQREQERDAKLKEYAERVAISIDEARARSKKGVLEFTRGRVGWRDCYYADERDALDDALIARCEASYSDAWGQSWSPNLGKYVRGQILTATGANAEYESEARKILEKVRTDFLKLAKDGLGGPAVHFLAEAVERFDAGAAEAGGLWGAGKVPGHFREEEIRRFISLASREPFTMGILTGQSDLAPTASQLTDLWILCGGRPELDAWPAEGMTVAKYHERQANTIAKAMKALELSQPAPDRSPAD